MQQYNQHSQSPLTKNCFLRCSHQCLHWWLQQSTGLLQFYVRVLFLISFQKKRGRLCLPLFFWCGQQDSNLHAHAVEPKSTESTNSTMPAYFIEPCRGDSRIARNAVILPQIFRKSQLYFSRSKDSSKPILYASSRPGFSGPIRRYSR